MPALSITCLLGYWLWNFQLRKACDSKLEQGKAFLEAANYRQAVTLFEAAFALASRITLGQGDRPIWCALNAATALRQAGQIEAAYQAATTAFMTADRQALSDYSVRLYTLMADLSEENGIPHRSVGLRQVIVALLRREGQAESMQMADQLAKLGAALATAGLPEHAAKALTEAVDITGRRLPSEPEQSETHARYLVQLGSLLAKLGDKEPAEAALKTALDMDKSEGDARRVPALSELGALYSNWNRHAEAFQCFEEAYRIQVRACGTSDAQVGLILANYATCLRKAGQLDGAEDAAARAVKLLEMNHHPGLASGLGTLASVLMAEGNYTGAVDAFEKADAASVSTEYTGSPLDTAERLENHAEALEHLSRALSEHAREANQDPLDRNPGDRESNAENLRSTASSIRATLAAVPPAEELFSPKVEDFLQAPVWPKKP